MSRDDEELSELMRRHATRHAVPDHVRAAVRTQLALEEARRAPAPSAPAPQRPWRRFGWGGVAGSFALGALCAALLLPQLQQLPWTPSLEAELVAGHVRALQAGSLAEVLSTDRHTVKPWFQGRIDYAPPVRDLAEDGFALIGGRIEHVRGRAVATLAYQRRRHVIDLYVWPAQQQREPTRQVQRGFNLVHWDDGSMQYWAVSDLDAEELQAFARLWQQRAASR
jgi:anti-sigma factor RsiW